MTKSDIHSTTNSASKTLSHLYWGQTGPRGWILVPLLIFLEKLIMRPHVSLAVTVNQFKHTRSCSSSHFTSSVH